MGFTNAASLPALLTGWGYSEASGAFEFPDARPSLQEDAPAGLPAIALTDSAARLMVGTLFLASAGLATAEIPGLEIRERAETVLPDEVYDFVGDALGVGLRELVTPDRMVAFPVDFTYQGVSVAVGYAPSALTVTVRRAGRTDNVSIDLRSSRAVVRTEPAPSVRNLKVGDLTLQTGVIPDLLALQAERYGDRAFMQVPAADGSYREVSFNQFAGQVERTKRALYANGVKPGDRVAFLSPNKPAFAEAAMGVWGLGATVVSMSVRAIESEELLAHMVTTSGANTLLVSAGPFLAAARKLKGERPELKILVLDPLAAGTLQEGEVSLATWEEGDTPVVLPEVAIHPDDEALILYTSGTTKLPKAVPLTHQNILYNRQASQLAWAGQLTDEDMTLGWLPFFHVMGLPFEFLGDLYVGARYAFPRLRPGPPTADQLVAALDATGANVLYLVPAMLANLRTLAEQDAGTLATLKRLKFIMTGGAPTDDSVGEFFRAQGIALINGYGMTEVGGAIALGDPARPDWKRLSPLPGIGATFVAMKGVEGQELVLAYSPTVMAGYRGNAEATAAAFREPGRFHTGDVFVESDGGIEHRGRNDELFLHDTGEKTNPQPIELELQKSPEVIGRACLVGHGRPYNVALVQPNYAALKGRSWVEIEAAIWGVFERVNQGLMDYSRIRRENIIILPPDAAPLNTAPKGSLIRPAIEKRFAAEIEARYARKEQERVAAVLRARIIAETMEHTTDLTDLVKRATHRNVTLAFAAARREAGTVTVSGTGLHIPALVAVARDDAPVALSGDPSVRAPVDASVEWLAQALTRGRDIYGVTAGFGASADVRTQHTGALQHELIRFLHSTFGDLLPAYVVRGAMLIRANSNIKGYSALRWQVLENLVTLLNKGITPLVPAQGSITASGDLSPLAHIVGVLIGLDESRAEYQGRVISGAEALQAADLEPIVLGPKEGLAVVNGTSVAASYAGIILYDTNLAALLSQACTAMVVEAMLGTNQSYDPLVQAVKGHRGQMEVGVNLLALLAGSQLARDELDGQERIEAGRSRQDRYALRTATQVLGPQLELLMAAMEAVTTELSSVSDNPVIDVKGDRALHTGNFQGTAVAEAMEITRMAIQHMGKLLFAQLEELVNKYFNNGLPQDVAGTTDPSLDFGLKGASINIGAYMEELAFLANSITNHIHSVESHNQDVNSLALIAARYTQQSLQLLQKLQAVHLYATTQAMDLRNIERAYRAATDRAIDAAVDRTLPTVIRNAADVAPRTKEYLKAMAAKCLPFQYAYESAARYGTLFRALAGEIDDVLVADRRAVGDLPVELTDDPRVAVHYYRTLKTALAEELDQALPTAREAALQQGAFHLLGRTRRLYEFVRRGLGIRFNQADQAPSVPLEIIFNAIVDGRIETPLLEAFFPGSPA